MEEEKLAAEEKRKKRTKLVAVMVVLIVLGIALYAVPIFLYPDNIILDDSLTGSNSHTTEQVLTIDKGTYEVWMTTSLWSWFMLDQPIVFVNQTDGQPIDVDYLLGGDTRNIEGEDCRHFATFDISEKTDYNISITAGVMALGVPGTERVFVVEERPSSYAVIQWSGILAILVGIMGVIVLLVLIAVTHSEENHWKKKFTQPQPPPPGQQPMYPPPPGQQPMYPPPPGQQQPYYPPPQGQPPAYESQPQPPPPRKGRSQY